MKTPAPPRVVLAATLQLVAALARAWALLILAAPAVSANWNAGADMAAIERPNGAQELANPNGQWSYGVKTGATAVAMTLYTPAQHYNSAYTANQDGYDNGDGHVLLHLGPTVYAPYSIPIQPLEMHWHPSVNASLFTTLRWTAPAAGTYYVSAYWKDINHSGGNGATAHLVVNGTQVFGQTFQNTVSAVVRNQQITLNAGDTVDFALGNNGEWGGDGTSFNAFVSTSPLNVVAHYRFENGPDAGAVSSITDSSQHQLHGTSSGAMFYRANTGTHSAMGAFSLDAVGDSDFGQVADNPLLHQQGDWTAEFFFKLDEPYEQYGNEGGVVMMLSKLNQTEGSNFQAGFAIALNPNTGRLEVACSLTSSSGIGVASTTDIRSSPQQWHHVAAVMDRDVSGTTDQLSIYVDGLLEGAIQGDWGALYYGNQPLFIGAGNFLMPTYRRNFDGHIDEVRISASALTPPEFLAPASVSTITHHTSTWNSTTGNWTDTSKWSTPTAFGTFPNNGNPIPTYDAIQNGGVLTVNQDITVLKFTMNGGTLNGPGSLTVDGAGVWAPGATISGDSVATDQITFNNTLTLSGTDVDRTLTSRTMNTAGTTTWSATRGSTKNFGIINNSGTWNATSDGQIMSQSGTFNNLSGASFNKPSGSSTQISQPFNNLAGASVNATGGTLILQAGGTQAGSFHVGSGAALQLMGGHALNAGVSFNGEGTLHIGGTTGGSATTANTEVAFPISLTVNLVDRSSGTNRLDGAGAITVDGPFIWNNNNVIGGASTAEEITFNNTLTITGPVSGGSTHTHNKRTMYTTATTNWTASDNFLDNYGIINNSGTWNATSRQFMRGDGGQFKNLANGVFNKSGANITYFQQPFVNAGIVNVNSGALQFQIGGSYTQTAGALVLGGGSVNAGTLSIQGGKVQGGGTITGAVNMSSGTSMEPGIGTTTGILNISDNLNLSGGSKLSFDIGGTLPGTGHDQINEGGASALNVGNVTLEVKLLNGFLPAIGETITVVQASTSAITGSFDNVLNGARLAIAGTPYSCQVNYGTNTAFSADGGNRKVILSHFATTPASLTLDDNQIVENAPAPRTVGLLGATDPNSNETFTFELTTVSGLDTTDDDNDRFEIVGGNQLQAKSSTLLDFELKTSYKVRLRVRNSGGGFLEQPFTIQVLDVPAPTSLALSDSSIFENQDINTAVGTFSATDPTPGTSFTYQFIIGTGSTDNNKFNINGNELRSSQVFDSESTPGPFTVRVVVTNSGGEGMSVAFPITLLNQGPSNLALSQSSILEGRPIGSTVGAFSTTVVPAGTEVTYSLVSGTGSTHNAQFTIDGTSLKTAVAPNFAAGATRSIRVRATGPGTETVDQVFTITIINAGPPTDIALSNSSIAENQPVIPTNPVVGTLSATDPDPEATFTFMLVDTPSFPDNARFNLSGTGGATLRSSQTFDKEDPVVADRGPFSIRVRVTNGANKSYDETLTITVQDVAGPSAIALTPSSITEGSAGRTVGTLSATLAPSGAVITDWALVSGGPDNGLFMLDGATVKTAAALPASPATRTIRVQATDANGEFFAQDLAIDVIDVEITDILLAAASVRERLPEGTEVGLLTAVATQEGLPATFELAAGDGDDDNLLFAINDSVLVTAEELDQEDQAMRTVRVRATVSGNTFEKAFEIQILDNDPNLVLEHPEGVVLAVFPAGDAVQFPVTEAGQTSEPKVFTIRNTGTGPLTDIEVPPMSQFTVDVSGMAEEIAPGETTTFTVRFSPQTPAATTGPESAVGENMLILSNDPDSGTGGDEFSLSGRAMTAATLAIEQPAGTVINDGSSRYFGLGLIGADGAPRTFTLTNSGEAPVRDLAVSLLGADEESFALDDTGVPEMLEGGDNTSFTVLMHPLEEGVLSATLRIFSETFGDKDITLTGEGLTPIQIAHQGYVKASNAGAGDMFGNTVAVDGETVVIGAPSEDSDARGINGSQDNNNAENSGAVYVLIRTGGEWVQQAYLKASNSDAQDRFGESVAIDGDTIVVGATGEGSTAAGVNGNQALNNLANVGAAYVFVRENGQWTQQAYLKSSVPSASDLFGKSVALSGDTICVSAPLDGIEGPAAGAAFVFTRESSTWSQEAVLTAGSDAYLATSFGDAVALSGNVIAASHDSSNGMTSGACIFRRNGTNWTKETRLVSPSAKGGFGHSLALSGGTVVVGHLFGSSAEVFVYQGVAWTHEATLAARNTELGDAFGDSVAIQGDLIAVSAPHERGSGSGVNPPNDNETATAGAVYLFRRSASAINPLASASWAEIAYLKASNSGEGDLFGIGRFNGGMLPALALSEKFIVAGASLEDSAATGVDGDGSDNSAPNAGAAYVFALESRAIQVYAGAELTADRVYSGQAAPVDLGGSPPAVPLTRTFTILNDGLLPLDISAVHVSGDFFVVDQGDPALPGFGAMQFTVQNEPGTSGPLNGTVQIESDDPDLPLFTFTLAGLVGDAPPTEIAIEQPEGANLTDGASTVNYGALTYSRTAARAFTVRNLGTQPLYIGAITITGADMADFAAGPPGQSEVQPGQATSFMVTFDPTGTVGGSRTAVLHVFSNDTDEGSFDITLTGTVQVPDIEVTGGTIIGGAPALDYGTVVFGPGKPGKDLAIGVFNAGQGLLEDFSFSIEGVHASDFSIINSAIFTSFGGAAQLAVRFLPQEEGPRSALLRVGSNDPDENPLLINLAGNGNALPVITQQPQSALAFTGESVTFTAAATGSGLTYQWLKDGIPFGSATPSLTIPNVLATSKGTYSCRVSNSAGVTFSSAAHLAVMASSPAPFPVQANEDTTNILSMASVSPPAQTKILYHWQKDGADLSDGGTAPVISGAFTRSLRLTGVKPASSGTYTCKVTLISSNGGGNLTRVGRTIVLTVGAKPVIAAGGPFEWGAATPVSDVITVTQNPGDIRYSGHPTGVRLSLTGAGQLTFQGKPTRIGSGTITVTASNAAGTSLPQTFNYTVAALPANVVGTFDGLVDRSSLFGLHNLGGKISVTVGSNGSWSAALLLGPKVYSLTASPATSNTRFSGGIFSGRAVVNRSSEGLPSLNLDIEIDASTGNLTGTLTDAALTSPQPGEVALEAFKGSVLPQFSYTAALEVSSALAGNPSVPQGNGFFTAKAGSNSTLTMAFKLADSTVKTYAGPVVAGARIPVFFSLYGNVPSSAGSVHGWITRTADTVPQVNGGRPLLNGALTWLKHPQPSSSTTRSYKEGFPLHTLTVLGGQYAPPPAGSVVLGLQAKTSNARFAFAEGGIEFSALGGSGSPAGTPAGIIRQVCTISTSNLLTLPAINTAQNPANVRDNSFDAATGLFRGTFILRDNDPTDLLPPIAQLSRNTAFEGVLVPRLGRGAGFFNLIQLPVPGRTLSTMPMLSGQVILEANP